MAETLSINSLLNRINSLEQENAAHYQDDQKAAQQRLNEAQAQSQESFVQERDFELETARRDYEKIRSLRSMRRNAFNNLEGAKVDNKIARSKLSRKTANILENRNLMRLRPIIEAREQAQNQSAMEQQIENKVNKRLSNIVTFRSQTQEQRLAKAIN